MVTHQSFSDYKFLGQSLVLDFVNTHESATGGTPEVETLASYGDLAEWSRRAGVLGDELAAQIDAEARAHPDRAFVAYTRALELRADADAIFRAIANGDAPAPSCLQRLRDEYREAIDQARLTSAGASFRWQWRDEASLDLPRWLVAQDAVDLLRADRLSRLKTCDNCPWLFLDTSKNRSRRWCDMNTCGAQVKMRRYRAAHGESAHR